MLSTSTCTQIVNEIENFGEKKKRNHFLLSIFFSLLLLLDLLGALLWSSVWILLVRFYQKFRRPVQLRHGKRHRQAVFRSVPPFFSLKLEEILNRVVQIILLQVAITCYAHLVFTFFVQVLHVLN